MNVYFSIIIILNLINECIFFNHNDYIYNNIYFEYIEYTNNNIVFIVKLNVINLSNKNIFFHYLRKYLAVYNSKQYNINIIIS